MLGLLGAVATLRLGPQRAAVVGIVSALAFAGLAQLAFNGGWIVSGLYPLLALGLGFVGALGVATTVGAFERERVRDLFARFVPEAVVDDVLARAEDGLRLGGTRKVVTVMFSDVRGFTAYSEKHTPEEVIEVLNEYLTVMSDVIHAHGGTLVAYMGDGIMAVFGAPADQVDHADRALAAAEEMAGPALVQFNELLRARGDDPFPIGVGLNAGPVMAGNVGSQRRMEYTTIGDTTNTASRLETMTKGSGHAIFLSESVKGMLTRPRDDLVLVDRLQVRGKVGARHGVVGQLTRWEASALIALTLAAFAGFFLYPTYSNYDSLYSLLWGRELLDGALPSFDAYRAPTQHPLWVAICVPLAALGTIGDRVLLGLCVLSFVALVAGLYRLGRQTFGWAVGLVAALLLLSRLDFPFLAARGYVDIPYLALIVWAAALEAQRPRRGGAVWVLLTLAGLLRPEAWLLAGAYALWIAWRRPLGAWVRAGALVAIAPVIWGAERPRRHRGPLVLPALHDGVRAPARAPPVAPRPAGHHAALPLRALQAARLRRGRSAGSRWRCASPARACSSRRRCSSGAPRRSCSCRCAASRSSTATCSCRRSRSCSSPRSRSPASAGCRAGTARSAHGRLARRSSCSPAPSTRR